MENTNLSISEVLLQIFLMQFFIIILLANNVNYLLITLFLLIITIFYNKFEYIFFFTFIIYYFLICNLFNFYIFLCIISMLVWKNKIKKIYQQNIGLNFFLVSSSNWLNSPHKFTKINSSNLTEWENYIDTLYKENLINVPEYTVFLPKINTVYENNLVVNPEIMKKIKLCNYVDLGNLKDKNHENLIILYQTVYENQEIYDDFWKVLEQMLVIKNNNGYKLRHFVKDFENDNIASRVLNTLDFIHNPAKKPMVFKMMGKSQFYGTKGEKWADKKFFWPSTEYYKFGDQHFSNPKSIQNGLRYDLRKTRWQTEKQIHNSYDPTWTTGDTVLQSKLKNYQYKTDFIDWDFFSWKSSLSDEFLDQYVFTVPIIIGFIYVQFYTISLIFNKFKFVNYENTYKFFCTFFIFIYWVQKIYYFNLYRYVTENGEYIIFWTFPEWTIYPILYDWWVVLIIQFFVCIFFMIFSPKTLILRGNNLLKLSDQIIYCIYCLIALILPIFLVQDRLPFWNEKFLYLKDLNWIIFFYFLIFLGIISVLFLYIIVIIHYLIRYHYLNHDDELVKLYVLLFSNCESNYDIDPAYYTKTKIIDGKSITVIEHKRPFFFFFFWIFFMKIFLYLIYVLTFSLSWYVIINILLFIIIFLIFFIVYVIKKYLKLQIIIRIKHLVFIIIFLIFVLNMYFI